MSRYAPSPTVTPAVIKQHMSVYTDAQYLALEPLKDDRYVLGIAREEFVNAVLTPGGQVIANEAAACAQHLRELAANVASTGGYEQAAKLAAKAKEMDEHVAANRFLFVVNEHGEALIYFQCATADNPDLPALKEG